MKSRRDKPYSHRLRGVDALIGSPATPTPQSVGQIIPLTEIQIPPHQPRRYFDAVKMEELVRSVQEHGILEPLLVRPLDQGYELVAGERRYRAASQLGLDSVPVIVKSLDNETAQQVALIENLQREDLNPVEETEGILALLSIRLGLSTADVTSLLYRMQNVAAGKVTDNVISNSETQEIQAVFAALGMMNWESFVANRLSLLRLPDDILNVLRQGQLAYTKAKAIARVKDENQRSQMLEDAIAQNLSLNAIKERIATLKSEATEPELTPEQILTQRLSSLTKQARKSKVWSDRKKHDKVTKLINQLEELLAGE